MSHVLVRCECNAKLRLGVRVAGKVCRCPKCRVEFQAPNASDFGNDGDRILPIHPVGSLPDFTAEVPQPEATRESRPTECRVDSHRGTAQAQVRAAIGKLFEEDELIQTAATAALALAAHPWPDENVPQAVLDAIAAEMMPARNLQHHEIREVAIDRLLRIADALRHESATQLAVRFTEAANELDRLVENVSTRMHSRRPTVRDAAVDLIAGSYGIGIPLSEHRPPDRDAETIGKPSAAIAQSIAHLLGLAVAAGSDDIGLVYGGEPTGITVKELAHILQAPLPIEDFDRFVATLDSRERDILLSRTFVLRNPDTLEEVAVRWSVTRERVRQLEAPLKADVLEQFASSFSRLGHAVLNQLTTTIARLDGLHAAARQLAAGSRWPDAAAAVFLQIIGPWDHDNGWAVHHSIKARVNDIKKQLDAAADTDGMLSEDAVDHAFENLFDCEVDRQEYATQIVGLGRICNRWTIRDTYRCRVVAALHFLGRPSTKEEISELTGLPTQNVGSIFGTLDGIVRADKHRWGFEEWVDDVYEGIVAEINQRIDSHGGLAPVNLILRELPTRFGVSEVSVRAYLSSNAFIVEDGLVRRAGADDEYTANPPHSCSGAVQIAEKWGQRVRLYERHFVGYSLGIAFDIAYANGIRPDDDLLVPVNEDGQQASVIWRRHSLTRTVDVGRVSQFLETAGYTDGDEIVVIPQRETVTIMPVCDVEQQRPADNVQNQTLEVSGDVHDPLLDLLGG